METEKETARLRVNCGIVFSGAANDVDILLSELENRGITLIYKKVSLGHLWIKEGGEAHE